MGDVTIRAGKMADVAAMQAVARAAYAEAIARIPDLPDVVEGIAADMAEHGAFVALLDGALVGFVIHMEAGDSVKIANLAVDPSAAGRGIARRLIAAIAADAAAKGKARLTLVTHARMDRAAALYRHLGWVETERRATAILFEHRL